jgi:phosphatidylserine/phosphatidylglycerophosphate/cardiolipin synthase-like enzyme
MENGFSITASRAPGWTWRLHRRTAVRALWGLGVSLILVGARPAAAQEPEQMLFPATQNAQTVIIQKIRDEKVRLDIAGWLLTDNSISQAIVAKHQSGVLVRVIGDRGSIFEGDPITRREFEFLANNRVPIRLRYFPRDVLEIVHWKAGIFAGQNTVEFGSANWTGFGLAPWSSTDFSDETVMFTNDSAIVRAFMTKFDQFWADTTNFRDWPAAYKLETGRDWTGSMNIPRPPPENYETNIPGMVWSQGPELNNAMIAEMNRETQSIDMVSYRLTAPDVTDALIRRHNAGVNVRVIIEPSQYRNSSFPEYWLVGAMVDRLWAAGIPVKQRLHQGITHMKTLITSHVALNASSNFSRFWQRDHNYFIPAQGKPSLYFAMKDRFNAMWNDSTNFTVFQPLRPNAVALVSPSTGSNNVPTTTKLEWNRAAWAVAFDVYVGTTASNLALAGRVAAVLTEDPPATYTFTFSQALRPSTTYFWRVLSRTAATDNNSALFAWSDVWSFTTAAGSGGTSPGTGCTLSSPLPGWLCVNGDWVPPAGSLASAVGAGGCTTPSPGAGWVCVNGGWLPPASSTPAPTPAPSSSGCTTVQPVPTWLCINGNWLPPDSPLAAGHVPGSSAPPPPSTSPAPLSAGCATPDPFTALGGGTCFNGNWLPPGMAIPGANPAPLPAPTPPPSSSTGCTTPNPFTALGGGTCFNGNWLPPGMAIPGNTAVPSLPPSAPPSGSSVCTTVRPAAGWLCINGGWVPPDSPLAGSGGSASGSSSSCSTPSPGSGWTCQNGGWLPPREPSSSCAGTPDPFVLMGGGVCINGNWIPRTHPLAGGGLP